MACRQIWPSLICIFNLVALATGMCQPPVEEKAPYAMDCSFPITSTRSFHWAISSGQGEPSHRLFTCDFEKNKCRSKHGPSVSVTYSSHPTTFTSWLKIMNVTTANRDAQFHCVVSKASSDKLETIKSCQVKIYHAPETPRCQSEQLKRGNIKMTCQTPKVYQDILCQLFEGPFEKLSTKMTYKKSSDSNAMYSSASCSFLIPRDKLNNEFLNVKMYASIDGHAISGSEKTVTLGKFTASRMRQVLVRLESTQKRPLVERKKDTTSPVIPIVIYSVIGTVTLLGSIAVLLLCVRKYRGHLSPSCTSQNDEHEYENVTCEDPIYDTINNNNISV